VTIQSGVAKTKGTNLVDMVKFLRTQREKAEQLLPPRLHAYLNTQLNVSAWYPEADMIELVKVLAKLLPGSGEEALVQIGRLNARMHLQGTYAHLLEDARPALLPVRAVALWRSMHDTGEFRLRVEDDGADAELAGYGHPSAEMCVMLGAYLQELFVLAGVRDPSAEERACCRSGAPACTWRIAWTPEPEPLTPSGRGA
jgi:hypothetical protein